MTDNKETTIFETPWIKIKRTPRGFDYLERKGVNSVAVFLIRQDKEKGIEVLVRFQPLCVHNADIDDDQTLYPCPVTGGLEIMESPFHCALREVLEETGYEIDPDNLVYLGDYIVGTQTNEVCYMYRSDITNLEPRTATQDGSYFESISRNEWKPLEYLKDCDYVACQLGYYRLKELLG